MEISNTAMSNALASRNTELRHIKRIGNRK
jgi:hypothetical protein